MGLAWSGGAGAQVGAGVGWGDVGGCGSGGCAGFGGGGAQVGEGVLGAWSLVLEEEGEFGIRDSGFGIGQAGSWGMVVGRCQVQWSWVKWLVIWRVFLARRMVPQGAAGLVGEVAEGAGGGVGAGADGNGAGGEGVLEEFAGVVVHGRGGAGEGGGGLLAVQEGEVVREGEGLQFGGEGAEAGGGGGAERLEFAGGGGAGEGVLDAEEQAVLGVIEVGG